jgi:hypothetical protein
MRCSDNPQHILEKPTGESIKIIPIIGQKITSDSLADSPSAWYNPFSRPRSMGVVIFSERLGTKDEQS